MAEGQSISEMALSETGLSAMDRSSEARRSEARAKMQYSARSEGQDQVMTPPEQQRLKLVKAEERRIGALLHHESQLDPPQRDELKKLFASYEGKTTVSEADFRSFEEAFFAPERDNVQSAFIKDMNERQSSYQSIYARTGNPPVLEQPSPDAK